MPWYLALIPYLSFLLGGWPKRLNWHHLGTFPFPFPNPSPCHLTIFSNVRQPLTLTLVTENPMRAQKYLKGK